MLPRPAVISLVFLIPVAFLLLVTNTLNESTPLPFQYNSCNYSIPLQSSTRPQAALPRTVFLMSHPQNLKKQAALTEILSHSSEWLGVNLTININTEFAPAWENGVDKWNKQIGCPRHNCRAGITLAWESVWQEMLDSNLPSALIAEDDFILHDNFTQLFPMYWNHVPHDFEVVFIGSFSRAGGSDRIIRTHMRKWPWCTHFVVLSREGAQRMLNIWRWLKSKFISDRPFENPSWEPGHEDVVIDWLFIMAYENFISESDRSRWIVFESTNDLPASFKGFKWSTHPQVNKANCTCANMSEERCKGFIPLMGTGLAYQLLCDDESFGRILGNTTIGKFDNTWKDLR